MSNQPISDINVSDPQRAEQIKQNLIKNYGYKSATIRKWVSSKEKTVDKKEK